MAAAAEKLIEQIDSLSRPEVRKIADHCRAVLKTKSSKEKKKAAVEKLIELMDGADLPMAGESDDPRLEYLLKKHVK